MWSPSRKSRAAAPATFWRRLLPKLLGALSFPKFMRWGEGTIRFVRPIRWLLAIFDGRVVPFEMDGLTADGKTYGHRFLAPRGARVRSFQEYLEVLESRFVIADPVRRRELVRTQATEAAAIVKGRPVLDEALVETVADLVEFPTAVCGAFKPEYLELPREVIVTPMQKHQRYFPVVDAVGNLLPYFVTISNMRAKDMELIRQGNERVLRARLNDAEFFFREDRKRPLPDRLPELSQIIFQEKLGSVADKVRRLQRLAAWIAERVDPAARTAAERAALLCKADLPTNMVKEFPNLQGTMGREYARLSGEPPEVCQAIEEHYLPRFAGDRLPASGVGAAVAMADRLDSIVGCFGIGLVPTGSEDPYALRRAALGVVQIILQRGCRLPLDEAVGVRPGGLRRGRTGRRGGPAGRSGFSARPDPSRPGGARTVRGRGGVGPLGRLERRGGRRPARRGAGGPAARGGFRRVGGRLPTGGGDHPAWVRPAGRGEPPGGGGRTGAACPGRGVERERWSGWWPPRITWVRCGASRRSSRWWTCSSRRCWSSDRMRR